MKASLSLNTLCGCALLFAALPAVGAAQAAVPQAAPPVQRTSACAGQAACYESGDFAAAITDFRVSNAGSGIKVIDTTIRFLNKTNQPLILGYVDGSGMAIDDQGNRYAINGYAGPNAIRGIGRVAGNSIDPKFVLPPGGTNDALFELIWRVAGTEGVAFEMDLTAREITPLEGNQFSLAGEFPLQFRGLAAGMFGGSAGAAAGQAPAPAAAAAMPAAGFANSSAAGQPGCTPDASGASGSGTSAAMLADTANSVAGQKMPAGASTAVSTATSQMAALQSIFGHKKAAAAAAAPGTAAAANPCVPGAASATGAATAASTISGVAAAVPANWTTGATGTAATVTNAAPQVVNGAAAAATTAVPPGQPMVRTATPTNAVTQPLNPAAAAAAARVQAARGAQVAGAAPASATPAGTVPAGQPLVKTATPTNTVTQPVNPAAAAAAARVQAAQVQAAQVQAAKVAAAKAEAAKKAAAAANSSTPAK
jgi:hypothetical protein